jgi:hypothetical protein
MTWSQMNQLIWMKTWRMTIDHFVQSGMPCPDYCYIPFSYEILAMMFRTQILDDHFTTIHDLITILDRCPFFSLARN